MNEKEAEGQSPNNLPEAPDTDKGVYFNLFNNQWGTNFPMWNEGSSRFRFVVTG